MAAETLTLIDPRKTFGQAVTDLAADDDRVVVLSADSGLSSGFGSFRERFPDRYYEFGIQEHGTTGVAAGLASTGKIPVFAAIAAFVTNRNYEAFRNDIAYMGQNVKIVGRNGGITYSDLGPTHYSLEDYAIIRMLPGVVVLSPQDPGEIREAAKAMIEHDGPVYMRIGGPSIPDLFPQAPFTIGEGRMIREGSRATVVTTGTITPEVVVAVQRLADDGVDVELIGMPTVEPVDASSPSRSTTPAAVSPRPLARLWHPREFPCTPSGCRMSTSSPVRTQDCLLDTRLTPRDWTSAFGCSSARCDVQGRCCVNRS